jgi:protease II
MSRTTHWFRGEEVPDYVKSKHDMVSWALIRHREGEPISNGEFIYEMNYSRFGSSICNLRKEGWEITTLPAKKKGLVYYYLTELPHEKPIETKQLELVVDNE